MQKDSRAPISVQLIIHGAMGAILGALLGLALIITNRHIFQLIDSSSSPSISLALFVGFFAFVVSTGASISGFFFTAIELTALEAKQQNERVNKQRSSGT
jgi:NhaP-type Na+/H+ or K+/H+ antiporter